MVHLGNIFALLPLKTSLLLNASLLSKNGSMTFWPLFTPSWKSPCLRTSRMMKELPGFFSDRSSFPSLSLVMSVLRQRLLPLISTPCFNFVNIFLKANIGLNQVQASCCCHSSWLSDVRLNTKSSQCYFQNLWVNHPLVPFRGHSIAPKTAGANAASASP